jgi:hypothetical protein
MVIIERTARAKEEKRARKNVCVSKLTDGAVFDLTEDAVTIFHIRKHIVPFVF